ncbi:MAG: RNA polymerase sigma factor [Bacteroidota bacterium]
MNTAEFNRCVDQYSDAAYRFILKNIRDAEKAQDIIQDAFEKLWLNAEKVEAAKAKSYLFTTAYHKMIDVIRKEKHQTQMDEVDYNKHAHSEQYSDLQEILHQAVQKLPEKQRTVLMLRDYEGYSYKEIGDITGLNEAQVKVYIYRARVFLKDYIGDIEHVL